MAASAVRSIASPTRWACRELSLNQFCNNSSKIIFSTAFTTPHTLLPGNNACFIRQRKKHTTLSITMRHSSSSSKGKYRDHCIEIVQKRDREGYLCTLLLPEAARRSCFAIRAFNAEIASVKDSSLSTSGDGTVGLSTRMRMAFWREALDDVYSNEKKDRQGRYHSHPILSELTHAVCEKNITRRLLENLLDARENDLNVASQHHPFVTVEDAVSYGGATTGSVLILTLECVGVGEDDVAADRAAYHAGAAAGLVTLLRSAGFRLARDEGFLPQDVAERWKVDDRFVRKLFLDGEMKDGDNEAAFEAKEWDERKENLKLAVKEMAELARAHLRVVRESQHEMTKDAKMCLLPTVSTGMFLDELEKVDYNIADPKLRDFGKGVGLTFQLGRAWLTGVL